LFKNQTLLHAALKMKRLFALLQCCLQAIYFLITSKLPRHWLGSTRYFKI